MANYQEQPQKQPQHQRATADANTKLTDRAQQAAEQAKSSAIEQVRQLEGSLEERRLDAADRIRRFGHTLRSTGELSQDDELVGRVLAGTSDRIDRVATYVAEADFRKMTRDLEGVARDQPAWFFGGAFLLGLAVGRFAKAATSGEGLNKASEYDETFESDDVSVGEHPAVLPGAVGTP